MTQTGTEAGTTETTPGRRTGIAYLAMLGFPVGAHRWYLGHFTAGAIYAATFGLLALARFAFRDRVEESFAPIWTIAVVLVVLQLLLDAIAIPRWTRAADQRVPLPGPMLLLLASLATIFLLPLILDGLGGFFSSIFDNDRLGRQIAMVIVALLGVPAVLVGYIQVVEHTVVHFSEVWQHRVRPWLWLAPALLFLFTFLVYPTYGTIRRSLYDQSGDVYIGFENYDWFFNSPETLIALRNNVLWLVFFTAITVIFGLIVATIAGYFAKVVRPKYPPRR